LDAIRVYQVAKTVFEPSENVKAMASSCTGLKLGMGGDLSTNGKATELRVSISMVLGDPTRITS
jgi:hypothetical protein